MPPSPAAPRARPSVGAAVGGDRGLRVDRRPDVPLPGPHRVDPVRGLDQPLGLERPLAPRSSRDLENYTRALTDPIFQRGDPEHALLRAIWVPLTMALGLFLAVIVNQKLRGRTFFRAAFYFPAIASSAAITILWIFLVSPEGLFNSVRAAMGLNPLFEAVRLRPEPELDRRPADGPELGHRPQRLDDVRDVHAVLPGLAPDDQQRGLRGGGDRRRRAVADVLADHVPAATAGHYFVATVAVIGALQLFDQAYIGGGLNGDPNNALMTVVLYLYNAAFPQVDFGYAARSDRAVRDHLHATLVQRRLFGGTRRG